MSEISPTNTTVSITLISDFNCPWCYVAHREIQTALKRIREEFPPTSSGVTFNLQYRPYLLDPTLPKPTEKPICRIACYKAKFGSEEKLKEVSQRLIGRGKEIGIDFRVDGKIRQSTNSHRLTLKAFLMGGEEAQTKMVEALFNACYQESKDIGCLDYLTTAAESSGLLSAQEARAFLESGKLEEEVKLLVRDSELRGIRSVPLTVIDNRWAIGGAEKADVYYNAFKNAYIAIRTSSQPQSAETLNRMIVSQTAPACAAKDPNSAASTPIPTSPSVISSSDTLVAGVN